jgi:hypothetical protein
MADAKQACQQNPDCVGIHHDQECAPWTGWKAVFALLTKTYEYVDHRSAAVRGGNFVEKLDRACMEHLLDL